MTLTLQTCLDHAEHALGGQSSIDPQLVVNNTGLWFVNAHAWKFLERPAATIAFVAGQSYADVPADFRELIKIAFTSGLTARFFLSTTGTIADYRTAQMNFGLAVTYGAFTFAPPLVSGPPVPRLELYPTPQTSDASALTMFYRGGWVYPSESDEDAYVPIPDYAEVAFQQAIRCFALGYQREDLDERLAVLMSGTIWDGAITTDGTLQPDFGKMRGGAVSIGIPPPTTFASPYSISSP